MRMIPKPKLLETLVCTVAGSDVQLRKTFVPKTHRFFYRYLTCNYTVSSDLEIQARGQSRSSERTRINPPPITSPWNWV